MAKDKKGKIIRQLKSSILRRVLAAPIAAATSEHEAIKLQRRPRSINRRLGQVKRHLTPLPPVFMAAVLPVSYTEFYRVVINDPHDGDPTSIFEDETPVHVGGVWDTPANIISAVCGDTNPAECPQAGRSGPLQRLKRVLDCEDT